MPALRSFRANAAAQLRRDEAIHDYSRGFKTPKERAAVANFIDETIKKFGPVVDGYPLWHPFIAKAPDSDISRGTFPTTAPAGFEGLDHTIYFRNAFLTSPYNGADRVIESVKKRKCWRISAEEITDVPLYYYNTTPVLVTCEGLPLEEDGTIAKRFALGSMLSELLPHWMGSECGETWEDMRRYILGPPCGSRSSLFVNQETGKALRETFDLLNKHELFGPVRNESSAIFTDEKSS